MPIKLIAPRKGKTPYYAGRGTYLGIHVDRSTKTGKRALAVKVIAKWEREIESGEFSVKGETTFASAAADYMRAGGERKYLKPLLEHFGEKPIRSIDQAEIDAAAIALYPNATPATRNRSVYTPISAIRRRAGVDMHLRRPMGSVGNQSTFWLWPEQAEKLFEEAYKLSPKFGALCVVLCYTGLRLSEALELTWDRVRLADGYAYIPDTKNGEPRAVFLPPVAVAALANLPGGGGSGSTFGLHKSGHIYALLKTAAFKAGVDLPQRSAFHCFRHTYATWMRRYGGLDNKGLVATGAWKDPKSADRYSHTVVTEEAMKAVLLPTGRNRGK